MPTSGITLRTGLEYAAILGIIIVFFGGSTLKSFFETSDSNEQTYHSHAPVTQDRLDTLVYPDRHLQCPNNHELPLSKIHIFSRSPLIIYIPNFISASEASHLVDLSAAIWEPSTIFSEASESLDTTIRRSEKALIPRTTTVKCIERRALEFQGWPKDTFVERLWTQRYLPGGHYSHHYDWAHASPDARRVSTFMVYVANSTDGVSGGGGETESLEGGGTEFPLLKRPEGKEWCEFIDCNRASADSSNDDEGVTFLPRAGAAVYWENFDAEGRGWREGLHAGLPVNKGVKIGLNIWSWYQKGHAGRGDEESGD